VPRPQRLAPPTTTRSAARLQHEGMGLPRPNNDSEVAAGYLTWRMSQGRQPCGTSLSSSLSDLDGFFTFVVGTRNGFAVLRDPIACKARRHGGESDDYVAFGLRISRACRCCPISTGPRSLRTGAGDRLRLGTSVIADARSETSPRGAAALNEALHRLPPDTNETFWEIENPQGKHTRSASAIDAPVDVEINGPRRLLFAAA